MINNHIKIFSVLILSFYTISCLTEDKPIDDVNTLRPNINQNSNTNVNTDANIAEDNEIKLKELINLPFEPTGDSPWREDKLGQDAANGRVPGPNDKKLTAVLKFSEEDTKKLLEKLEGIKPAFKVDVDAESWFPAELIAKSETKGDNTLNGKGFSAEDFYKSPYLSGSVIYIEGADYFVLVLQTQ